MLIAASITVNIILFIALVLWISKYKSSEFISKFWFDKWMEETQQVVILEMEMAHLKEANRALDEGSIEIAESYEMDILSLKEYNVALRKAVDSYQKDIEETRATIEFHEEFCLPWVAHRHG